VGRREGVDREQPEARRRVDADEVVVVGDLVYDTRIRKTVRYAEAPVKGSSVLKYDPSGPAAQAYRDLAKEVLDGAQARDDA
jgi:cellulose biosynthesis protein BcsQ